MMQPDKNSNQSQKGRVILITGSTDGIGRQTALRLAEQGAHVLLHGRNPERGRLVIKDIYRRTGNPNLEFYSADFSSLKHIQKLAKEIKNRHDQLHVLINNAGTYMEKRRLTDEGFETTFAVNYLAPFLLTTLLLDILEKSVPARIITVSSEAHSWIDTIDWSNLQGERSFNGLEAYALSKLGNILFTFELAERLNEVGVTANCLHPGKIITKLSRASGLDESKGGGVEKGAQALIYLATSPFVEKLNGLYFEDLRPTIPSLLAQNRRLQKQFWQFSERLIKMAKL
jgi:NAD(P)-dependent dehydrogenase (short-subunit alcohol dehydrogenase family)